MPSINDFKPGTNLGRFKVSLEGQELKVETKIFIDSPLSPEDLVNFKTQAQPIIKENWENKFGFSCKNNAYKNIIKPVFTITFEASGHTAHYVMTMTDTIVESVSSKPFHGNKKMGFENLPSSVKMKPTSASDGETNKSIFGAQILESLRNSFPFYADGTLGSLSSHAQSELKLLVKEVKKLDPSAVLNVTGYGVNKDSLVHNTILMLKAAGLSNVLKRRSKKIMTKASPRTGSMDYVKVTLSKGLGDADPSNLKLFHYPATIVHEYGHMLGLTDEYACLSKEAADKMADLNFIHSTEKDMFQKYAIDITKQASPESQTAQAKLAEYCKIAGVEPAQYGNKTISIMSAGSKFFPRHFITLWSAIVELTKDTTKATDWTIVKLTDH